MKYLLSLSLVLVLAMACQAGITVPADAVVGEKVVATVDATVPPGAVFDGGWSISCDNAACKSGFAELKEPNSIGVWASNAGTYTIEYSGFWLLTKEVSFTDGEGNEITITSYLGHGFITERAVVGS